ncbi:hypothetical protein PG984_002802 [Apiospora sp. TS-2023a]
MYLPLIAAQELTGKPFSPRRIYTGSKGEFEHRLVLDLDPARLGLADPQVLGALVLEVVEEAPEHLLGDVVGPDAAAPLGLEGLGAAIVQPPRIEQHARRRHGRTAGHPGLLVVGKDQVTDLAQNLVGQAGRGVLKGGGAVAAVQDLAEIEGGSVVLEIGQGVRQGPLAAFASAGSNIMISRASHETCMSTCSHMARRSPHAGRLGNVHLQRGISRVCQASATSPGRIHASSRALRSSMAAKCTSRSARDGSKVG